MATVASLLVVLLLTALIMRPLSASLMAMASLLVGGLDAGRGRVGEVKITFLNFIALPNQPASSRAGTWSGAVVSTGSVALCSWTTIVGYGSRGPWMRWR